jgi:hypothetical protein
VSSLYYGSVYYKSAKYSLMDLLKSLEVVKWNYQNV